jgi:GntR family transcriptional regulator, transcriptional repressor for pyruvate dehydrogenase complex
MRMSRTVRRDQRDRIDTRPAKKSEVLARDILARIGEEGLGPGDPLPPEAVMVEHYGVGRASLREALRILEVNGLLVIKAGPGGGPIVAPVTSRDFGRMATMFYQRTGATMADLMDTRVVLESMMARLAAQQRNPEGLERLRALVDETRAHPPTADDEFLRVVNSFHDLVAGISGNPVLDLICRSLGDIHAARVPNALTPRPRRPDLLAEHDAIARAILAGNANKAERLMRTHMEQFRDLLRRGHAAMMDEIMNWG